MSLINAHTSKLPTASIDKSISLSFNFQIFNFKCANFNTQQIYIY